MANSNFIRKVAIVGAGGSSGSSMTEALLSTGKHTVTALTRQGSSSEFPNDVHVAYIDYAEPATLVAALRGQDALVITLPTGPLSSLQTHLIRAAAAAGVRWILPNEWAQDSAHAGMVADIGMQGKQAARREIAAAGVSSFVGVVTGPWYEMGMANAEAFGFDFRQRRATLYDRGRTRIATSTWRQVGRAVAALLSLPVRCGGGEGGDGDADGDSGVEEKEEGVFLDRFRNRVVYLTSFSVTQHDIFESILRVTGDRREDWTLDYEAARVRYQRAREGEGMNPKVAVRMAGYARLFFPDDDAADFETHKGTINAELCLPAEDLDEATRHAIELLNIKVATATATAATTKNTE